MTTVVRDKDLPPVVLTSHAQPPTPNMLIKETK